jgi:pilus assembly protein CpaB
VKRRLLTVTLALLLAVLGVAGVLVYVKQANARAIAGQKAVTVLVAGSQIPAGTSASAALKEGLLARQTLPAASVPADAVRSIGPDLGTLVMSADVQPGQLLLRPMLVASVQATGALAIPKGMLAVTIDLCMPAEVAGYVRPGSKVAVFDTYSSKSMSVQQCNVSATQATLSNTHTRILLPSVEVLAVGPAPASSQATTAQARSSAFSGNNPNASTPSSQSAVMVTLAVSQADAERLVLIHEVGLPYLALLSSSSKTGFDTTFQPLFQR